MISGNDICAYITIATVIIIVLWGLRRHLDQKRKEEAIYQDFISELKHTPIYSKRHPKNET